MLEWIRGESISYIRKFVNKDNRLNYQFLIHLISNKISNIKCQIQLLGILLGELEIR